MHKPFYDLESYNTRSVGWLVRRLNNLMVPQAERLFADQDLTFSHWMAIKLLQNEDADTCGTLARCMNYDSGAVTRLIDQLEERGLVERTRSHSDRRIQNLSLTPQGRTMWRKLTPRMVDYWNTALDDFTHEEAETLLNLLERLLKRLEAGENSTKEPAE
jgi:DNA-binding MarR family transcriptional regulator